MIYFSLTGEVMHIKQLILLSLVVIIAIFSSPIGAFSYQSTIQNNSIVQYIVDLSKDIYNSITPNPDEGMIRGTRGHLRLKILLSPWGELKDAYIVQSSGNTQLDEAFLKAVWMHERYQPFPEGLGDRDRWIDVPIIFDVDTSRGGLRPRSKQTSRLRSKNILRASEASREVTGLGLNEAVDIALENSMLTKIAMEEIDLSRLKIREAKRALFPTASLNYIETTGETTGTTQDFTDKEYKVKFEYPLYYGWQLKYAVEQAISNMKASRQNYDKVVQDLRLEVELAFYSYLAGKINVNLQRALLKEAEEVFDTAKKRYSLDLSTSAEFLKVESQIKQISYQVTSTRNELDLARLTLQQALSLRDPKEVDELININTDIADLKPVYIDMRLRECMDLASRFRPDLKAKERMMEFNEYGRKIALSKDQLRVDFTGTYGKSGGAYESEDLTMDEDWYVGIKLSKPLGGNTLSTVYTEDDTSEKHGQTSRTKSISKSVEFGLLDNLQSFSEKKSSEIALKKAMDELKETEENAFKEVKESYLGYKKGFIQVSANLNKIKYREEELKVAKARCELNDIPFSELIQAHMNLTDEKSFYIESIGSLYQSLAKLNKATGYALFLDSENFMLANAGK